jgi:hypothetical protein
MTELLKSAANAERYLELQEGRFRLEIRVLGDPV